MGGEFMAQLAPDALSGEELSQMTNGTRMFEPADDVRNQSVPEVVILLRVRLLAPSHHAANVSDSMDVGASIMGESVHS